MAKLYVGEVAEVGGHADAGLPPGHEHPGNKPIYHPGHPSHGLPVGPEHIGNRPIYHPGHPSHGLPIGPEHIGGGPIFHPGHPEHGLPAAPVRPSNELPIDPGRPENSLPPGGQPIVINPPLPPPSGDNAGKIIVAIFVPGKGWTVKGYPVPPPFKPEPPSGTAPKL